MLFFTIS